MKKIYLHISLIFLILLVLPSCSKDSGTPTGVTNQAVKLKLSKKWKLIEKKASGEVVLPTPDWTMEFINDGTYFFIQSNNTETGLWDISEDRINIILTKPDKSQEQWQIIEVSDKALKVRYYVWNDEEYSYNPY
jgi:hypothetical protein